MLFRIISIMKLSTLVSVGRLTKFYNLLFVKS